MEDRQGSQQVEVGKVYDLFRSRPTRVEVLGITCDLARIRLCENPNVEFMAPLCLLFDPDESDRQ